MGHPNGFFNGLMGFGGDNNPNFQIKTPQIKLFTLIPIFLRTFPKLKKFWPLVNQFWGFPPIPKGPTNLMGFGHISGAPIWENILWGAPKKNLFFFINSSRKRWGGTHWGAPGQIKISPGNKIGALLLNTGGGPKPPPKNGESPPKKRAFKKVTKISPKGF